MIVLKIIGAGYLLWLAYKASKSALTVKELDIRAVRLTGGMAAFYKRGLIIKMTNAKIKSEPQILATCVSISSQRR